MIFPVTHSVLSTHALQKIIQQQYHISPVQQLNYFQAGLNDTYLIITSKQKYILRAYRTGWRSESDIHYEIDALNFLLQNNIPVSTAINRRDGGSITKINAPEGLRYLVLFHYIAGEPPTYKNNYKEEASAYGQIFGKMHRVLKKFSSSHTRFELNLNYLLNKPLQSIRPFLSCRPSDEDFLMSFAETLIHNYQQLTSKNLQKGFCHGDLNTANVHINKGKIGLFDFDCCGYGYYAADIAAFRWGARIEGNEKKIWPPFLTAYQNENPLNETDLDAVKIFVCMRHIWHIGLHIQLSDDRGRHWLNDSYFDQQIELLKNWQAGNY